MANIDDQKITKAHKYIREVLQSDVFKTGLNSSEKEQLRQFFKQSLQKIIESKNSKEYAEIEKLLTDEFNQQTEGRKNTRASQGVLGNLANDALRSSTRLPMAAVDLSGWLAQMVGAKDTAKDLAQFSADKKYDIEQALPAAEFNAGNPDSWLPSLDFAVSTAVDNLPLMLATGAGSKALIGGASKLAGAPLSRGVTKALEIAGTGVGISLPEKYSDAMTQDALGNVELPKSALVPALMAFPHAAVEQWGVSPAKLAGLGNRTFIDGLKRYASRYGMVGAAKYLAKHVVGEGLGEAVEEPTQGVISIFNKHLSNKDMGQAIEDSVAELAQPETWNDLYQQSIGGFTTGMIYSGGKNAIDSVKGQALKRAAIGDLPGANAEIDKAINDKSTSITEKQDLAKQKEVLQLPYIINNATADSLRDSDLNQSRSIHPFEVLGGQNPYETTGTIEDYERYKALKDQDKPFPESPIALLNEIKTLYGQNDNPRWQRLQDYIAQRYGTSQALQTEDYPAGKTGKALRALDEAETKTAPTGSFEYDPATDIQLFPYEPGKSDGRQLPDGGVVKDSKNNDVITLKSGKPFKNEKIAKAYQTRSSLKDSHDVTPVRGGFVLMKKPVQNGVRRVTVETPKVGNYQRGPEAYISGITVPTENRIRITGNSEAAAKIEKRLIQAKEEPTGNEYLQVETPATVSKTETDEKRQWYIDADDKPVFTTKSNSMGYRGPYSKHEVSELLGTDKSELKTNQTTGKQAKPAIEKKAEESPINPAETDKQPVTKSGYTVKPHQSGFSVIAPDGSQFAWSTNQEAAENRAEELNSGKVAPAKVEAKTEAKPATTEVRITAENAAVLANAQKLRKSAASLLDQAQSDLNRERQTNTARRARMAAGATDDAANREAFAKTMNNLADAMERGEVKYLKNVKSRPDLMLFKNELAVALGRHARKNDKSYDWHKNAPITESAIRDGAEFNRPHPYGDWFDFAVKELEAIQGMKPAAAYVEKLGRGNRSRNVSLSDEAIDKILDIKKTIAKKGIKTPYQFARILETVEDYQKLRAAGIKSDFDLADALIEYHGLAEGKKAEDPIKVIERGLIGKKFEGFDFFPTPPALARRMANELDIKPGMKVLEPSAGKGDLADAVKAIQPEADIKVIEPLSDLREILKIKDHEVIDTNFESFETDQKFDRIIMNPPFSKNRDTKHVRKAYELLAPGGKMIAIMGNHFTFANDKESVEFRDWLDGVGGTSESLGQAFAGKDAFRQTGVNSQLVTIEKPAGMSMKSGLAKNVDSGQTDKNQSAKSDLVKPEEKDFESAAEYLKALTAWRENTGNLTAEEIKKRDRALRYAERAAKTDQKASGLFRQADKISERFYMSQPILVGHHSERGARNAQNRMWNKMDAARSEEDKAKYYAQKAESAESNKSISSGDEDAIIKLKAKLETLNKIQERMKQANKVVKASKLTDAEKIAKLQEQGFSEAKAKNLLEKDFGGRVGFPAYKLQNNNAEMGRIKKRIEELTVKQSQQTKKIAFDGGEIIDNVEENRLQIFFDSKPDEETREKLKSGGFKWAPSAGAWQRHRSSYANSVAEKITGAKIVTAQSALSEVDQHYNDLADKGEKKPLYSVEYLVAKYTSKAVKAGWRLLKRGVAKFSQWAKSMLKKFGKSIGSKLRALYADLQKLRRGINRTGAIGDRFKTIEFSLPIDNFAPKIINPKAKDAVQQVAAEFKSWPNSIVAADGNEILLHNPEGGSLGKRVFHLIRDIDTGKIKDSKIEWVTNIPDTLANATVRMVDEESGNKLYVRGYRGGDKHIVVVRPDGSVSAHDVFKGKLITQFKYQTGSRQGNMRIEWENPDKIKATGTANSIPPYSAGGVVASKSDNGSESLDLKDKREPAATSNNNLFEDKVKNGKVYAAEYLVARYTKRGLVQAGQIVKRGLELIKQAGVTFAKWARQMVNEFGQAVKKHLRELFKELSDFNKKLGKRGAIQLPSGTKPLRDKQYIRDKEKSLTATVKGVTPKNLANVFTPERSDSPVLASNSSTKNDTPYGQKVKTGESATPTHKTKYSSFTWLKDNNKQLRLRYTDPNTGKTDIVATITKNPRTNRWEWKENPKRQFFTLPAAKAFIKSTLYERKKRAEKTAAAAKRKSGINDDYFDQIPEARVKKIDRPETWKEKAASFVDKATAVLFDKWHTLKKLQQSTIKANGMKSLPEEQNAYQRLEVLSGRIQERTADFKDNHWQPILDHLNKHKITYEQFNEFLRVMHAEERNEHINTINPEFRERGIAGSGMSDEVARAKKAEYAEDGVFDTLMEAGEMYWKLNNLLLDEQVKYGLLSQEMRDSFADAYKHYTPLKSPPDQGRNLDKRTLGRRSESSDQLAYTLQAINTTFARGEVNRKNLAFLRFALANPNDALYTVHTAKKKAFFNKQSGEVEYRYDRFSQWEDEVLHAKANGQDIAIRIKDVELLDAIKNRGDLESGFLVRQLHNLNRVLSAVNTAWNPEFIMTNLMRDVQTAMVNASADDSAKMAKTIFSNIGRAIKAGYEAKRGRENADTVLLKEFELEGGKTGYSEFYQLEELAGELEKEMNDRLANGTLYKTKQFWKKFTDLVGNANEIIESGTRFAGYLAARNSGMSKQQAAALAKNLTVNFNKKGTAGQLINTLYLFGNASLQGSARVVGVLRSAAKSNKGRAMIAGTIGFGFVLDVINRLMAGDDEEEGINNYDKIMDSEKDSNFILMIPGKKGKYLKFPMPHGFNVLPALGRNVSSMMFGDQSFKETAGNILGVGFGAFNPMGSDERGLFWNLVPTSVKPALDIATNSKWTGRRIRPDQPMFGAKQPNSQLAFQQTSKHLTAFSQWLNEVTGGSEYASGLIDVSPADAQHLLETTTGGMGKTFLRSFDSISRGMSKDEDVELGNVPFIRRLAGSAGDYSTYDRFRSNFDKVKVFEQAKRERNMEWIKANRWLIRATEHAKRAEKQIKSINSHHTLTEKQKQERVVAIQKLFNKRFKEMEQKASSEN